MATTPTQLSMRLLRNEGYGLVAVVEKWNPHARIRQDLFGFADLVAVDDNTVTLVQTTSRSNMSARRHKLEESTAVKVWLQSGTRRLELHGWRKKGRFWEVKIEEIGGMR